MDEWVEQVYNEFQDFLKGYSGSKLTQHEGSYLLHQTWQVGKYDWVNGR